MKKAMKTHSDIEGHVFVVTYGRSGSTLVQNLLNAIPGYCIRGENANALGPLVRAWNNVRQNDVLRNLARNQTETTAEHPWFGGERIASHRFGRQLANLFVREILTPPPGTRVTGFKEIRWSSDVASLPVVLNFLHTFLPNTKFVFNTRNHDDVARSAWWAEMPPEKAKAMLVEAETAFDRYRTNNPGRCVLVHYDDYVADHAALKPMYDFLGEPFDPAVVDQVMGRELTHLKGTGD